MIVIISHHPYHLHDDCHPGYRLRHHDFLLFFFYIHLNCILGNAEDATMIVIMTVIRSFGNAEDATMIVVIRVIILIIFMMIVIIVIAVITFDMYIEEIEE